MEYFVVIYTGCMIVYDNPIQKANSGGKKECGLI